jgi:hypothetical protein
MMKKDIIWWLKKQNHGMHGRTRIKDIATEGTEIFFDTDSHRLTQMMKKDII